MLDEKSEHLEDENLESGLVFNQSFVICKKPKSQLDLTLYCWDCQPISAPFTTLSTQALSTPVTLTFPSHFPSPSFPKVTEV